MCSTHAFTKFFATPYKINDEYRLEPPPITSEIAVPDTSYQYTYRVYASLKVKLSSKVLCWDDLLEELSVFHSQYKGPIFLKLLMEIIYVHCVTHLIPQGKCNEKHFEFKFEFDNRVVFNYTFDCIITKRESFEWKYASEMSIRFKYIEFNCEIEPTLRAGVAYSNNYNYRPVGYPPIPAIENVLMDYGVCVTRNETNYIFHAIKEQDRKK